MGQLVNPGTPPPHKCTPDYAPGRPSKYDLNFGAVWQCECGKFWQLYEQRVTDFEGDDYGTERWWREVKDAEGTLFKTEEVPPAEYLTNIIWFWANCSWCGSSWVSKRHRHTRRV